ncbi:MAG: hypothetical protein ACQEWV_26145 [Bacillota bacterium]
MLIENELPKNLGTIGVYLADKIGDISDDYVKLFLMYSTAVTTKHQRFVEGILISDDTIFKDSPEIDPEFLKKLNLTLRITESPLNNFSKLKYFLDTFFFKITEKGVLNYNYQKDYLLKSSEIQESLNISRATLHRYTKLGLEYAAVKKHNAYPAHNIFYWKNGSWALKIQALYQAFKIRNRTGDSLIIELKEEIKELEEQYKGKFEVVFADVLSGKKDVYDLEEPDDFTNWRDLIEELKELKAKQ